MAAKLQLSLLCFLFYSVSISWASEPTCYDELGCFYNDYPWSWLLRPFPAPQEPKKVNTTFHFSNRNNPNAAYFKTWPTIEIPAGYDARKQSFILTHGFFSSHDVAWMKNITDSILQKVDANVFTVNWASGASTLYSQAAANARIVGSEISRVIKFLVKKTNTDIRKFHLAGHSLGSHIMAYAAKNTTGIRRITALDPAQPGFQRHAKEVRLDNKDAEFIDVIHTDGKPFLPCIGLGMSKSVGDVDFFVNGGKYQPNCLIDGKDFNITNLLDLIELPFELMLNLGSCSHTRAPRYWASSIIDNQCKMWANRYKDSEARIKFTDYIVHDKCDAHLCTKMGLDTQTFPARGNFALKTNGEYPFCIKNKESDKQMKPLLEKPNSKSFFGNQFVSGH
ncbi:inactive pancreatic lipase-related protein 1-like [Prorops nasuta]|uniref:inactive pancreatic lipase-related protein 1-like n=1 Tax=Prorops nasuta TaxID=863751 RepID=UPI0034CD2412